MILGIGTDMIEIDRVIRACESEAFVNRIFTIKEALLFLKDKKKAASNFAVKEAVVKAFGTGFGKVKPIDIEVLRDEWGKPYINLYGEAKKLAKSDSLQFHVSLTNTKKYASAFVVAERCKEV